MNRRTPGAGPTAIPQDQWTIQSLTRKYSEHTTGIKWWLHLGELQPKGPDLSRREKQWLRQAVEAAVIARIRGKGEANFLKDGEVLEEPFTGDLANMLIQAEEAVGGGI